MRALCPGSFDPVTRGHLDVIQRAAGLFDEVVVAVGRNTTKNYLFEPEERARLVGEVTRGLRGVSVHLMSGLLVDACRELGVDVIVKGVRAGDADYELQMAHMNTAIGGPETVWLPAAADLSYVSSTMIREISRLGGDVSQFVPPAVADAIRERRAG